MILFGPGTTDFLVLVKRTGTQYYLGYSSLFKKLFSYHTPNEIHITFNHVTCNSSEHWKQIGYFWWPNARLMDENKSLILIMWCRKVNHPHVFTMLSLFGHFWGWYILSNVFWELEALTEWLPLASCLVWMNLDGTIWVTPGDRIPLKIRVWYDRRLGDQLQWVDKTLCLSSIGEVITDHEAREIIHFVASGCLSVRLSVPQQCGTEGPAWLWEISEPLLFASKCMFTACGQITPPPYYCLS